MCIHTPACREQSTASPKQRPKREITRDVSSRSKLIFHASRHGEPRDFRARFFAANRKLSTKFFGLRETLSGPNRSGIVDNYPRAHPSCGCIVHTRFIRARLSVRRPHRDRPIVLSGSGTSVPVKTLAQNARDSSRCSPNEFTFIAMKKKKERNNRRDPRFPRMTASRRFPRSPRSPGACTVLRLDERRAKRKKMEKTEEDGRTGEKI